MLLATTSKMFSSNFFVVDVVVPFSPLDVDLGPVVDVDFVVSSLVRDDLDSSRCSRCAFSQ